MNHPYAFLASSMLCAALTGCEASSPGRAVDPLWGTWSTGPATDKESGPAVMHLTFKPDGSFKGTITSTTDHHQEVKAGGDYYVEGTKVVVEEIDAHWIYHVDKDSLTLTPTEDSDVFPAAVTLKRIGGPGPIPPPRATGPADLKAVLDHIHAKLKQYAVDKPAAEAALDERSVGFPYPDGDVEKAYALGTAANVTLRTWIASPRAAYQEFALRALSAINGKRSAWLNVQMLTSEKPAVRFRALFDLEALFPEGPVQERAITGGDDEMPIYVRLQVEMRAWLARRYPDLTTDQITDGGEIAPLDVAQKIIHRE